MTFFVPTDQMYQFHQKSLTTMKIWFIFDKLLECVAMFIVTFISCACVIHLTCNVKCAGCENDSKVMTINVTLQENLLLLLPKCNYYKIFIAEMLNIFKVPSSIFDVNF